ncbi:sensor histidine kinase KdpD [bacterium]|nr:sensor histidine kinase KdpD [bacterium]
MPRAQLKIFLGYCSGVGKTYAMLAAARTEVEQGQRLLVGLVETHGRPETEALLSGLPILPRRSVEHRGVTLAEFDLDSCLERKPGLVVLDELAHHNAPGARHPKRFQDIEELLEAGINVFTTLNVQHLESLQDAVLRITGVRVTETVPDRVLHQASFIELVDLPGEELVRRLLQGKVYLGEMAEQTAKNFFRPGNLVALRELAMRWVANRIDQQVVQYMRERSIAGPWPVRERLLVGVGPSPLSERLIRAARRLADTLQAEWLAVSVQGGESYTPAARERVAAHLRLATSLGAHSEMVTGSSVPARLVEYAREHNVTQIVTGKPVRRGIWRNWTPDLVDQLIQISGPIDVHVISADRELEPPAVNRPITPGSAYLASTLAVIALSLMIGVLSRYLAPTNLVMAYLALVCVLAFQLGRGPAFWASTLSLAVFDFCFVPPYYTFAVQDGEYVVTFAALLFVSLIISTLTSRAREQAATARLREGQTIALLDLSRDFSSSRSGEEVRQALESHVRRRLDPQASVFLQIPRHNEWGPVADWAWHHGRPAGRATDTLPQAAVTCLPVVAGQGSPNQTLAMLVLARDKPLPLPEQEMLDSFLLQAAVALERLRLAGLAQQAEVLQTTEKLQTALINSVSHDLRIPLVSIMGALQALHDESSIPLADSDRCSLVDNALAEADRLNRIVGNLLQMSQLDSGVLRIQGQPQDVQDLLAMVPVESLRLPDDLPLVFCDFLLTQQVLYNLLDNARKYAPNSPITVGVEEQGEFLMIYVQDNGPGVPEAEREQVFGRFYRARTSPVESGSGLGLSICQGLVESQGGRIWIEPADGCRVCFTLPIARG